MGCLRVQETLLAEVVRRSVSCRIIRGFTGAYEGLGGLTKAYEDLRGLTRVSVHYTDSAVQGRDVNDKATDVWSVSERVQFWDSFCLKRGLKGKMGGNSF